jgi:hypothetical protein
MSSKMAGPVQLRRAALAGIVAIATHGMSASAIAVEQPDAELQCLALTVYHEARGEPEPGKLAVAHVVINRSRDARFPRRICDVVYQHVGSVPGGCEFSWTCDALTDEPKNAAAWQHSFRVARRVYSGRSNDPTDGAIWYHADYVEPEWAISLGLPQRIGRHLFYRDSVAHGVARASTAQHSLSSSGAIPRVARAESLLPAGTIASLKHLRITLILYGPDPHDRTVRINNVMYRQGDPLTHDLTLASIDSDAVVVRYRDRLFRFPL